VIDVTLRARPDRNFKACLSISEIAAELPRHLAGQELEKCGRRCDLPTARLSSLIYSNTGWRLLCGAEPTTNQLEGFHNVSLKFLHSHRLRH
jgi:hypothetical protein